MPSTVFPAGPGQTLDEDVKAAVSDLGTTDIKVQVSLSCTMCPELVIAAQRIAAENPNVTAEIFDVHHFPAIREKYKILPTVFLLQKVHNPPIE